MYRLVRNILVSFVLLSGLASAQTSLDTLRQYRVQTYRQLGWDTAGTNYLPVTMMDKFVIQAINQLPNWVFGEEKVRDILVSKSNGDAYYVDSNVVQVVAVIKHDGDTLIALRQRPPSLWNEDRPGGDMGSKRVSEYQFFADTLYLYPSPTNTSLDTLRVMYYQGATVSSEDSTAVVVIDRQFQYGVVYLAAYLVTSSLGNLGDWQSAWNRYVAWAEAARNNIVKRPVDIKKDER